MERYNFLFRLGRKSGITIGLDRSRGDRTWDYVRSVSFMYGSLRRRFWDEKTRWRTTFMLLWNLLAINLCWDCIMIRNDIYDFLLLTFYTCHILQPSNVAFALIFAPTKPQMLPWLSYRRQRRHFVTSRMTRHHIFAPTY